MQLINRSKIKKDYLICTGESFKLQDIIEIVFDRLGLNWKDYVQISEDLFRKSEIQSSEGDPLPMQHDLGWKAKIGIKELIDILIKYELREDKNIHETF